MASITDLIINTAKKSIKSNPLSLAVRKHIYNKKFATAKKANLFKGIFDSFEEAAASSPKTKNIGYDNEEPANMYHERMKRVYPADYPVMFWLSSLLKNNASVFDLGGHIGVTYYAYKKYLDYPETLDWTVCDVPEVVKSGKTIARQKNIPDLTFTSDYKALNGYDILLLSGSLQYIDIPLSEIITAVDQPPRHVMVNMLPIYNGQSFVTLQNIGTAFCPYRIFNTEEFITSMQETGYKLIDIWENAEKSCHLPFNPEHSLKRYHGLYFEKN